MSDPDAPKGGPLRLAVEGTFDSFNPYIIKGNPAAGVAYETLAINGADEPFTMYGLLADRIEWPEDRSWVIYHLRPEARWHDGVPITADDVIFSLDTLKAKGHPQYRYYYAFLHRAGREAGRAHRQVRVHRSRKPRAAADHRAVAGPAEALLGDARLRRLDPGAALAQRALQGDRLRGRALCRHRAGRGLLGQGPAGERRAEQFRQHPLRLLPRRHRHPSGAEGRGHRLPPGERGQGLGAGIRRARRARGPSGQGRDPAPSADGMQAFVVNLRRPLFQDPRVRQAIGLAFDFEWTNRTLFFGQYTRTESFFSNSETGRDGPARGRGEGHPGTLSRSRARTGVHPRSSTRR